MRSATLENFFSTTKKDMVVKRTQILQQIALILIKKYHFFLTPMELKFSCNVWFYLSAKLMTQQLNSGTNSTGLVASLMLCVQQQVLFTLLFFFFLTKKRSDMVVKPTQILQQKTLIASQKFPTF